MPSVVLVVAQPLEVLFEVVEQVLGLREVVQVDLVAAVAREAAHESSRSRRETARSRCAVRGRALSTSSSVRPRSTRSTRSTIESRAADSFGFARSRR